MSAFDDLWSKTALSDLGQLMPHVVDQVEALVREICRDPFGPPGVKLVRDPAGAWVAEDSLLAVMYRVDEVDRLVYVVGVEARG